MATNHYYLKDKKVDFIRVETQKISGVTKKVYYEWLKGLWCYYRQIAGGVTLEGGAIRYYDNKERIQIIINNLPVLREKNIASFIVRFEGRYYDVQQVDNYEGYADDLKLICQLNSTGIEPIEPPTE